MKKNIYVALFNGFSDWELAYATPEIRKSEAFELKYFTQDGWPATSMGGLQVMPDLAIKNVNISDVHMLILPGGTAWEVGENEFMAPLVKELEASGKLIAAICAATTFLGKLGILDNCKHTSNDLGYLKAIAPQYKGEGNYLADGAVTDQNIITANGISTIEFAREIFLKLNLYSAEDTEKWFQLFKNGVWSE